MLTLSSKNDHGEDTAIEVMLSPRWSTSQQTVLTLSDKNDHGVACQLMLSIFAALVELAASCVHCE